MFEFGCLVEFKRLLNARAALYDKPRQCGRSLLFFTKRLETLEELASNARKPESCAIRTEDTAVGGRKRRLDKTRSSGHATQSTYSTVYTPP